MNVDKLKSVKPYQCFVLVT